MLFGLWCCRRKKNSREKRGICRRCESQAVSGTSRPRQRFRQARGLGDHEDEAGCEKWGHVVVPLRDESTIGSAMYRDRGVLSYDSSYLWQRRQLARSING